MTDTPTVSDSTKTGLRRSPAILVALVVVILVGSGISPFDRLTWALEVFPVLIGVLILVATYWRFPLTTLLYVLLFIHAVIFMIGGHYTYAEVPVGFWVQDAFDLGRNHYDRLGHFAQGFVPAILAREILKKWSPLTTSRWLPFLIVAVCLAFSAFYEMIEWWSALIYELLSKVVYGLIMRRRDPGVLHLRI